MKTQIQKFQGLPVFMKALLLVFVSAASVTVIISLQSTMLIKRMMTEELQDRSLLATSSVADHSAGALRFGKLDKIEEELATVLSDNPGSLLGMAAYDSEGVPVLDAGRLSAANRSAFTALVDRVRSSGKPQRSDDGFLLAIPVTMGAENAMVGIITSAWSPVAELARIRKETLATWINALLALGIGLALTAYLMRRWVSRPLADVTQAMMHVSNGELDTDIPHVDKGDEVGRIARALEDQRQKLLLAQEADALAREASAKVEAANDQLALQQEQQQLAVTRISQGLEALADGDLTCFINDPFGEEYETLRKHFNLTLEGLQAAMTTVRNNSESIRNGAEDISRASENLSSRTETQAATLEQAVAALDELTTSIKAAADGAKEVEGIVLGARTDADRSGEVVKDAVEAMNEIETSSNQIQQIIAVIDDIAFQTNLLALNAGVEAARAGEAGKGFAVVATEVRALAQRSSEAALQIKSLIGGASQQVERGVTLVGRTGEALTAIVKQVTEISHHITRIASSAVEQSEGLSEITTGMNQLDNATQQNAAMAEEATAATHTLKAESRELTDLVSRFRTENAQASRYRHGTEHHAA